MSTTAWIVIGILAFLVLLLATALIAPMVQRARLHRRFGPEYDRSLAQHGGHRRQAEQQLTERERRRKELDIRPLDAEQQRRYGARWEAVQAEFVDQPEESVDHADSLVSQVMHDRGYHVEDFDDRADLVSVDHPHVVEHYRAAHDIHLRNRTHTASTEDLRQAFVHYRALFDELLYDGAGASSREVQR